MRSLKPAYRNAVIHEGASLAPKKPGLLRTVLFGDSMTSQMLVDTTASAASYAPDTGTLTLTFSSHGLATGWTVAVFNKSYPSLLQLESYAITRIDSTSYSVTLDPAAHPDLPNGALAGTTFARVDSRYNMQGFVYWLQALTGWPLNVVHNGAQSGDTVNQCIARFERDVLEHSPDLVVMQCPGVNDMSTSNSPVSVDAIWSRIQALLTLCADNVPLTMVGTITPVASGESRGTLQNMHRIADLNRRLLTLGTPGICVVDSAGQIVNPSSTTGLADATLINTTDLIHYAGKGAFKVAKLWKPELQKIIPASPPSLPRSVIDSVDGSKVTASSVTVAGGVATFTATSHGFLSGERVYIRGSTTTGLNGRVSIIAATANTFTFATAAADGTATGTITASRSTNIVLNPLLATGTGGVAQNGVTGTVAAGLYAENRQGSASGMTGGASVVAHPDGWGNMQQLQVTAAAIGNRPGFGQYQSSSLNADAVAGRIFRFEAELRLASSNWALTGIGNIKFRSMVNAGGVLYSAFGCDTFSGATFAEDCTLHLRAADLLIPEGAITQLYWECYVETTQAFSAGPTLTMQLSRPRFEWINADT